ncbi:MAG: ABC transporter permease subunit [bacterium]|nr:ABC transporter permease subunit [bacterium]
MNTWEILRTLVFGYPVQAEMLNHDWPAFAQQIGGLCLSLVITISSLVCGAFIGVLLAIVRSYHPAGGTRSVAASAFRGLAGTVVEGVRGVPILILILLTFYLPSRLFDLRIPAVFLATGAFSLYAGVYLSEIFRSGFRVVDQRCIDAARTLGMGHRAILMQIRLPIAARAMTPAIVGLAITVFKDTSVLVVVAVAELTFTGRLIQTATPEDYSLVLSLVLLLYWSIATVGAALVARLEQRWKANLAAI